LYKNVFIIMKLDVHNIVLKDITSGSPGANENYFIDIPGDMPGDIALIVTFLIALICT
jgi:hypothetical protein